MTTTPHILLSGKHLRQPSCIKYRDPVKLLEHRRTYSRTYWRKHHAVTTYRTDLHV